MRVLGISIGTRRNGIAVILYGQLQEAQIHSINVRWSEQKSKAILLLFTRYIETHHITKICIKIPKASHLTLALKHLLHAIEKTAHHYGCSIECMSIEDIKRAEVSVTNRKALREYVASNYAILLREQRKDIANRQPYYMKLFEAVMVADIATKRNSER